MNGVNGGIRETLAGTEIRYTVKLLLAYVGEREYRVDKQTYERLQRLAYEPGAGWIVFEGNGLAVGVSQECVLYWHFLVDEGIWDKANEKDPEFGWLDVHFMQGNAVARFEIEQDLEVFSVAKENYREAAFQDFFMTLETLEMDMAAETALHFPDVDGEEVVLCAGNMVLVETPLSTVQPEGHKCGA